MLNSLILAVSTVPKWVSDSFPIIRLVMLILIVIFALFMIIVVLTQSSASEGLGALSGSQDTFFGKNKGKTIEGTMKRLTVIAAICLVVLSVLFFVSMIIFNGQ